MDTFNEKHMIHVEWALRIAMFAVFFANGIQAFLHVDDFISIVTGVLHCSEATAGTLLTIVGILDMIVAIMALFKPIRIVLIWGSVWVVIAALAELIATGEWSWDLLEKVAHILVPYALLFLRGWPKSWKELFS